MPTNELDALIARVEKLTGPDREVDRQIQVMALGVTQEWQQGRGAHWEYHKDGFWVSIEPIPAFTASLDALMVLADQRLPGYAWAVGNMGFFKPSPVPPQYLPWATVWTPEGKPKWNARAETVILALLLALLHALRTTGGRG